MLSVGL